MKFTTFFLIFLLKIHSSPRIISEISLPKNFIRISVEKNSFAEYLRNLELNTNDNQVYLFNGKLKSNQEAQYAVLNFDIGNKDLQQCADAVIRLRAEYLFREKKYSSIEFSFLNGQKIPYTKYRDGFRTKLIENKFIWKKIKNKNESYKTFREYLDFIFTYANTASLIKELEPIQSIKKIRIGDVFIQTRNPFGHAVIVIDIAENLNKEKIFLLAQSYMPAQSIHVLKNPNSKKLSPWYFTTKELNTPEWDFTEKDLFRFKE